MTDKPLEQSGDPDLRASYAALLRAAASARELARQTGTRLIVSYGGNVRRVTPDQLGVTESGMHARKTP